MKFAVVILVCAAVLAAADEVNPGLRSTVSNDGLEYAKSVLQPMLIEQVKTITIPDMESKVHTPVGHIKLHVKNIRLTDFSLESSSIVLSAPNVGTISLKGIAAALEMKWHYSAKVAKDSGHADVHTKGASITINAHIGRDDSTGAPTVTVSDTGFDCGDLEVKLHGGASWLYNAFISAFKGKIRSAINKEVPAKITKTINEMISSALASIPLSYDFGNGISLCYALADVPLVIPDYGSRFVGGSVAEFYVTKEGRGKSPYKPSAMPKTTATSAPGPMLELFVNRYSIDTLAYSFVNSHNTQLIIDDKNAPEEAKPLLVSGYYESAAPGLVKKYGYTSALRFEYEVELSPVLYMMPEGFLLETRSTLMVDVNDGGSYIGVIGITMVLQVSGSVSLKDTSVVPTVKAVNVSASVASSSVGNVDIKGMQKLTDFVASFSCKQINDKLAGGIPLPVVKGISFVDPKIQWDRDYFVISSSFSYQPPN